MLKVATICLWLVLAGCVSLEEPVPSEPVQSEDTQETILQETAPGQGVESTYDCEPPGEAEMRAEKPRQVEAGVAVPVEKQGLGKPKAYTTYRCPQGPK
jgi:hypothetical protein